MSRGIRRGNQCQSISILLLAIVISTIRPISRISQLNGGRLIPTSKPTTANTTSRNHLERLGRLPSKVLRINFLLFTYDDANESPPGARARVEEARAEPRRKAGDSGGIRVVNQLIRPNVKLHRPRCTRLSVCPSRCPYT